MVVASFSVTAFVPTLWVLLIRQPQRSMATPTAVGLLILVAFSHFSYQGIRFGSTLESFSFEPPGCTFSASFPGPPEVRELVQESGLVVTQANFYGRNTLMRAECLPAESTFVPTRHDVITQLREHADRNGLLDVEFEIREGDGFVRGLARGLKTISGNAATYEVHLLTDGASAMSLAREECHQAIRSPASMSS
jgi:hypothetical protein